MQKSFTIVTDVFSKPDKNGNQRIVKKNVEYKRSFELNNITISNYIDEKGKVQKTYCLIKDGDEYFRVKSKYEDIEILITPLKVKGFK